MPPAYVDASVLCYAFETEDPTRRANAQRIIQDASDDETITSSLTIDEFLWVRKRRAGMAAALNEARSLLRDLPLRIVAPDRIHLADALRLIEELGLDPRDAIHAAVCLDQGCDRILTSDADFEGLEDRGVALVRP